ncbi:MAG: 1-deoxy-D-xylulose-5-phosphate synthase, partial [Muribaculaceae bacterium]|nr:1-deoxy-D-xylulose-5-phosphate synthase [Muribaculaceae bacterium]
LRKKGILTEQRRRAILRFGNSGKSLGSKNQEIFEGRNIRYFGPIDGNDVRKLVKVFREIKDMEGPRLLHICTTKGKGYRPAELDPTTWHAPGKFDPATGKRLAEDAPPSPPLWQDVFGETLVELAKTDPNVMGVTAAMPTGTSMCHLMKEMPERTFDVGISEGHAVTFAGGLAAAGKKPFVAIYSSFLQRAYDNIVHDVAIQGLPVTFCIDRAGVVGEDGVTHHGLFDLAYLSCIPGMSIASPADEATLRNLLNLALTLGSPLAIRYPRGKAGEMDWKTPFSPIVPGKGRLIKGGGNAPVALLTIGPILKDALTASELLKKEGIETDIYDMIWMKPLDLEIISNLASHNTEVITVEDGVISGGFGQTVASNLNSFGHRGKVVNLGVPDKWVCQGKVEELKHFCGYDVEGIVKAARDLYNEKLNK